MDYENYKRMKLTDIATVERVKKGVIYKAGTIFIQVSATRGQIFILDYDSEVGTRYVSIIPKIDINPYYLKISIEIELPEFLFKVQTGLNIQCEAFNYLSVCVHDRETQDYIAQCFSFLDREIESVENMEWNGTKTLRRVFLLT